MRQEQFYEDYQDYLANKDRCFIKPFYGNYGLSFEEACSLCPEVAEDMAELEEDPIESFVPQY